MEQKKGQTAFDVFISYRRNGGSEKAQLVKSELQQRGVYDQRIFLDTHSLHEGNFKEKIKNAISASQNVIVIISQGCFDQVRETDYWYLEIREALLQGKNIIPVLFDKISSLSDLNIPEDMSELKEKNCVSYQHEYADAAFDKLYSFLGLDYSLPKTRRGILMKYKGCMLTIMLTFIGMVVLVPIGLSFLSNTTSPEPSMAKVELPKDSSDQKDRPNRTILLNETNEDGKQLASAKTSPEENSKELANASNATSNVSKSHKLSWANYSGDLYNDLPHGVGELYVIKEHHLGGIKVLPGERIKGRFQKGGIIIAILHKKDGSAITLRNIQLVD